MIYIEEQQTKKLPGKTSLFVKFEYNKDIVEAIKTLSGCVYDKKTCLWECPINTLSEMVNKLSCLDDVDLKILEDETTKSIKNYKALDFKTKPFDYQLEGINWAINQERGLLLDPPGLGKTIQMLYAAETLQKEEDLKHCLIICGINTLKANWKKEIERHSKLNCKVLGEYTNSKGRLLYGGLKERIEQLKNPIEEFFVITNIETLRNDDIVKLLNDGPNKFDMIVFDEVHKAKSPTSQQGHNLLKLTKAKYRIGLTGTLIVNNPLDAYVPLKWIGEDRSTYTNFKYFYCNYTGPFNNILVGFKNTNILKDQLEGCSLRRSKDLLKLPPKTIIDEIIDMDDIQAKFYKNITEGIVEQVDKVHITTSSLLAMLTRLRQATSCPAMLSTETIPSSKIDRCLDLIEEITSNGEKVVVFSTFKEPLSILQSQINPQLKPLLSTGDVDDLIISNNIDKFQSDDSYKVMLCTEQKMGTGITLTAASYAIFLDSSYTRALNEQCEDRIYRIGSDKPVFIYYLWNTDTVDMRVKEIVEDKSLVSDYVVDDKCSPQLFNRLKEIILDL